MEAPTIRLSKERRRDLANRGITDEQIAEVEAVLSSCMPLIEGGPRLQDTRAELDGLIAALSCVQRLLRAPSKAAQEALIRWQMAARDRGHPLGSDPEFGQKLDLETLLGAARAAKRALGNKQRRSHAANAEPIRRIADALALGWAKTRPRDLLKEHPYRMPPRVFVEVVQFAYEAMGAAELYTPERALRTYRRWCKQAIEKQRAQREPMA
jgi:hypothetical protein